MRVNDTKRSRDLTLVWPLLVLTLPGLVGCEFRYAVQQGWHQARLLSQKRPIQEVLDDPSVDGSIKEGILLVQEVREFGESRLGLSASRNYRSFIEIQGDVVAFVVSASRKDRLEPFMWRFPILGLFPYKGFFDRREAEKEEGILKKKGYDTHISGAVAFSALGWFTDPLYSSMLRMPKVDLIYTVLHEMVHGTAFFKDHVDFNERLATFVGWKGTVLFAQRKYGTDSREAREAVDAVEDEKRLARFLEWAKGRLTSFYALPLSTEAKLLERQEVFREIQEEAGRLLPQLKTRRFAALDRMTWNNASFMALWRYRYDVGDLDSACERSMCDPLALMAKAKEWMELGIDPEEAVKKELLGTQE